MPAYYKGYLRAIQLHISNCYPFESILPAQTESELFWADFSIDLVLLSIPLNREEFVQKQTQMLHCFSGKIIKFRPPDWLHLWCELPVAGCLLPALPNLVAKPQSGQADAVGRLLTVASREPPLTLPAGVTRRLCGTSAGYGSGNDIARVPLSPLPRHILANGLSQSAVNGCVIRASSGLFIFAHCQMSPTLRWFHQSTDANYK